jgi:hypothetical protein
MKNKSFYFGAAALLFLSSLPASADFSGYYDPANWTTTATGTPPAAGGSVDTTLAPASIVLNGGDNEVECAPNGTCLLDYTIQAPATGTLSFDWAYATTDSWGPAWDLFVLINGAAATQLSDSGGLATQSGSQSVTVNAGDVIGFRIDCTDCTSGPATVTISQFSGPLPAAAAEITPVPTLSEWGMIVMAGLMALAAFVTLRRSNS